MDEVVSTGYLDINVTNGASYYFSVMALNKEGAGDQAAAVHVLPRGEGRAPDPPMNLSALPWDSLVILSWSPPRNNGGLELTEYRIYRGAEGAELSLLANATINVFIDYEVHNDIPYNYSVSAVNIKGESNRTGRVPATPFLSGTVPDAPRNLNAKNDPGGISLGWDVPETDGGLSITGYLIYRGTPGDQHILASTSSMVYLDTTAVIGNSYSYRVTALNRKGESEPSQEASAVHNNPPGAVTDLTIVQASGKCRLSWSTPGDDGGLSISRYKIYGGSSEKNMQFLCSTNDTNFTDNGQITTLYYYKVVAINGNGEGTPAWLAVRPVLIRTVPSGTINPIWWTMVIVISGGIAGSAAFILLRGRGKAKK
jgi:fibronectin type 3 domain-containing protein